MEEAGIDFGNFHEPADYSSDEGQIAEATAIMTKDVTAAIEAFNLGYKMELVRNARRETLDQGYCSDEDSD
jgi:hypothetical protein